MLRRMSAIHSTLSDLRHWFRYQKMRRRSQRWPSNVFYFHQFARQLRSDCPVVDVVIDFSVFPVGFGDFLYLTMFARICQLYGKKVRIYFIVGKLKAFYRDKGPEEYFWNKMETASQTLRLAGIDPGQIPRMTRSEFVPLIEKLSPLSFPSRFNIENQIPSAFHLFNIINTIAGKQTGETLEKLLLSPSELPLAKPLPESFNKGFISWHVRNSSLWHPQRNLTQFEFRTIFQILQEECDGLPVVVVSAANEIPELREWAKELPGPLWFTKDFGDTYTDDAAVWIRSRMYLQYKGGGVAGPLFSRVPYVSLTDPNQGHEFRVGRQKLGHWSRPDQVFAYLRNTAPFNPDRIRKLVRRVYRHRRAELS